MGAEVHGARGRRDAGAGGGAGGGLLRQDLRRRPFSAGRAAPAAEAAREVDRFSLAAMFILAALCLLAGILPGLVIDALAPVATADPRQPHAGRRPAYAWLSIVPIAESRSSYNGLLVMVFIAMSALAGGLCHPSLRLACAAPRTGLGLRLSRSVPAAQYSGVSFAQPIRRVFGTLAVPAPATMSRCRRPAIPAGAAADRTARSGLGAALRSRLRTRVGFAADTAQSPAVPDHPALSQPGLRHPRHPAAGARDMVVISDIIVQGVQMLLVLLLAPLLTGFVRKIKARLVRRQGASMLQPYRDLLRLLRKEVVLADNASWLFRVTPYIDLRGDLGRRGAGADLRHRPAVQLDRRPDRHRRAARQRTLLPGARGDGRRHQFRRHRLQPRGDDRGAGRAGDADDRVLHGAGRRLDATLDRRATSWPRPMSGLRVSLGMAMVALFMVALAENARIPVDNPATHLELTMVHEAMVLEYSGRHLAMIEFGAFLKLLLYVSLIACVFFPWKIALFGSRRAGLRGRRRRLYRQARGRPASCSRCSRPPRRRCGCFAFRSFSARR